MSSSRYCSWLSAFIALTILRTAAGRPEITQHPSEHDAYPNEMFSMSCTASGSEFRMWIVERGQDRREIEMSTSDYDVTRTTSSSTLTIKAFRRELAGEYRCLFTTENVGSILTRPAAVKHFAQVTVEKPPQDFQSYALRASNGAVYREVFAFQCSLHTEPFTITPVITWEKCNSDNTFSPVVEATQTVPAPGITATNIVTPTHIFFQTDVTGYLQIHDTNNSAHQGTRYRCKASSSIAQDTQPPVYSGCAQIIYQANTVPVPEDLPVFSTVPHRRVYFDRGHQPVMACSVQRRTDLLPPKLVHSEELLAIAFISFLASTTHIATSHLTLLGQLNLQFNGNAAVDMNIFEQTFTCQAHLNGESILHNTTFYRDRPLLPTSDSSFENHTFREGDQGRLNFMFKETPNFQQVRVFNNGQRTALSYSPGPSNDRLVFTIAQVGAQHEGVTQLEVENRANLVTQYHYVHVLLMARSVTPNRSVKGRVTQTLTIKSKAKVNLEDTSVTFTWKIGDQEDTRIVPATDGIATDEFNITDLNMAEYHGKFLDCYPSNTVGGYNFTRFDISVEQFPPPNITKFAFRPDSKDAVDIEWSPVDVTGYPGASVEEYYIELARDKDGSDIEARFNVTGSNTSHAIPVEDCSIDYWVRIKAVNGDHDVSTFSAWTALTATGCPLVAVPAPQPLQGWAIFLIVFFLLLFCCLCLFLYCCIVLLLTRDKEGEYNAEKREKQYQSYRAAYTVRQEHECATLAKLSYVSTEQWTQMHTV